MWCRLSPRGFSFVFVLLFLLLFSLVSRSACSIAALRVLSTNHSKTAGSQRPGSRDRKRGWGVQKKQQQQKWRERVEIMLSAPSLIMTLPSLAFYLGYLDSLISGVVHENSSRNLPKRRRKKIQRVNASWLSMD